MTTTSRWDALPLELRKLVLEHRAAAIIQRCLWRHFYFRHVRQSEWGAVREHLRGGVIRALWPYPLVRREWRSELRSWLAPCGDTTRLLIDEAREGLWGRPSARLVRLLARSGG